MTKDPLAPFLTSLSFTAPDVTIQEQFHEATKISRESIKMDGPWVGSYLTDPRAILETAQNHKRFFLSERIRLPQPAPLEAPLASVLKQRKTAKSYTGRSIGIEELSAMLGGAIASTRIATIDSGRDLKLHLRPYASGGGLFPIEVYPLLLSVDGLEPMVTHYDAASHELSILRRCADRGEILEPLSDMDERLAGAAVVIIMTAVFPRTTVKYGARGYRFAVIEAGEIAQNLSLAAQALGLGTLPWGGYFDDEVADLLRVNSVSEAVVHCLSVGEPK